MRTAKTACEKRCQDCLCLVEKDGKWTCSECFGQLVNEIDECPEGITLQEVTAINENAKENKVKNIAASDKPRGKSTRERKIDEEKEKIVAETAKFLEKMAENIKITNVSKLIEFDIGENHYKLDLIKQRKPKNGG